LSWSYSDANNEIWKMRGLLERGQDPVAVKQQQRASGTTFGQLADQWIDINQSTWSERQLKIANLNLRKHAAVLTTKLVASIDADAIEQAIKPLWDKTPKQARRTLAMWQRIFAFAKHKKMYVGDNPADWKGSMAFRFPKLAVSAKRNYAALPYADIPDFIRNLRIRQAWGIAASMLEFQILTATRPGETRCMMWDEVNFEDRVWTIPAERMKRKDKQHRVPLSNRAIALLERQREYRSNSPYVFTGYHKTKMDEKAARVLLLNMNVRVTAHGFRASFKSWATEQTNHSWEFIELCLAHQVGNQVAQAYLRGDALDKRRVIMEQWASYCAGATEVASVSRLAAASAVQS
jgi:integrase